MDEDENRASVGVRGRLARLDTTGLGAGAGWGALATVVMSAVMLAAAATGISPMPKPVPAALVSQALGVLPGPGLVALAVAAHLGYGTVSGALLAGFVRWVTVWRAIGYGVLLWALMGLVWLPYLGWGPFGTTVTPKIAVATLALHLIYGAVLGLALRRRTRHLTSEERKEVT